MINGAGFPLLFSLVRLTTFFFFPEGDLKIKTFTDCDTLIRNMSITTLVNVSVILMSPVCFIMVPYLIYVLSKL